MRFPPSLLLASVVLVSLARLLLPQSAPRGDQKDLWLLQGDCPLVPEGRLPYVASIRRVGTREHVCTGVLVHNRIVITLAKCVDPQSSYSAGARPLVHLGATNVNNYTDIEVHQVKRQTIHPRWYPNKEDFSPHNIALLELARPSESLTPALLDEDYQLQGRWMDTVGYAGKEIPMGGEVFNDLKIETAQIITREVCNRPGMWNGQIGQHEFCAINDEKKASCVVDSGSPMVFLDVGGNASFDFIVALNLGGAPCGKDEIPDVYLDLRSLRNWIQGIVEPSSREAVNPMRWQGICKKALQGRETEILMCLLVIALFWVGGNVFVFSRKGMVALKAWFNRPPEQQKSPFEAGQRFMELKNLKETLSYLRLDGMEAGEEKVTVYTNRIIGSGAGGTVKEGLLGRRPVAVKMYQNPATLNIELRIAKVVSQHTHPNIVGIHGVGLGSHNFIIMERLSHNLHLALLDPYIFMNFSYAQMLNILMSVLKGLKHLHGLEPPIIHRDVKPSNILLSLASGGGHVDVKKVKVNDFDLSKQYEDGTITRNAQGTKGYIAPELWYVSGERVNGEAVDMYAFGILMWECVTGRPERGPLVNSLLTEQPRCIGKKEIIELIKHCTQECPAERPTAAVAVERLESLCDEKEHWGGDKKLWRRLEDLIDFVHTDTYSSERCGGFSYVDILRMFVSIAREMSCHVFAEQGPEGFHISPENIIVQKNEIGDEYQVLFVSPLKGDDSATSSDGQDMLEKKDAAVGHQAKLLGTSTPNETVCNECTGGELSGTNPASFADLMDRMLLCGREKSHWHIPTQPMPEELADFIKTVRKAEGMQTYDNVVDGLAGLLSCSGSWLNEKVKPCRR